VGVVVAAFWRVIFRIWSNFYQIGIETSID